MSVLGPGLVLGVDGGPSVGQHAVLPGMAWDDAAESLGVGLPHLVLVPPSEKAPSTGVDEETRTRPMM